MTSTYKQTIQKLKEETQPHLRRSNYYQRLVHEARQDELSKRGINAAAHTDFQGVTHISLAIPPHLSDTLEIISDLLAGCAKEARAMQKQSSGFIQDEIKHIERMALNVFTKTKSIRLAARASKMRPAEIRKLLLRVNSYHSKMARYGRNKRIYELRTIDKLSLRKVGSMFKLNHNTVKNIEESFRPLDQ